MYRGTTPVIEFVLPFDTSLLETCYITFNQNSDNLFTKELNHCTTNTESTNTLYLKLTQEETLSLQCSCDVLVQIRCRLKDGNLLASKPSSIHVGGILMDGEI